VVYPEVIYVGMPYREKLLAYLYAVSHQIHDADHTLHGDYFL